MPAAPQYRQVRNKIHTQLGVIRQNNALIDAYDMDGWRGARCVFLVSGLGMPCLALSPELKFLQHES